MFRKKKTPSAIDPQQLSLVEYAQERIAQKTWFHRHLLSSLFLIFFALIANLAFEYKAEFMPFNTKWSFALATLVFTIEPRGFLVGDKELTAVGIRACIGHRQDTRAIVF